jgi:hypothetical protein
MPMQAVDSEIPSSSSLPSAATSYLGVADPLHLSPLYWEHFGEAEEDRRMLAASGELPRSMISFLSDCPLLGEDHPVVQLLKACIHVPTGPIIRLKEALTSRYPTSDKSMHVEVGVCVCV